CVCVCQIFLPVLLVLCTIAGVKANNIRVEGKTRVTGFTGDTAVIEVTLRWDNSWRDDFNWDAAWVFFKYKKRGLENPWQHAYLSSSGHLLNASSGNEGGGYAYMVGANAGKVNGLYVMRNGISEGNVSVRLQAKWPLNGTGLTKSDFGNALNEIYVAVHAIEMVYVPYGAYYLGDASSYKSFAVGDTAAVVIDSESALTLSAKNGMPNVSLAASYPKGYAGFYVMKYETSQEQYVEFLNSLTLEQQKARVANNNFATMKRGDYVFGDLKNPSCRNGIVFIEQRKANTPVVFGNNLNPNNDLFSTDDGQTLACNYMSVEDLIAYCSWSGLRPMSELEYEKACRRFYPQVPDKGEYAWNINTGVNALNGLGDLAYLGDEREVANNISRNVNGGTTNSIDGPVRCGLFATSATNQTQAGATYWGVMEMSGNLKELCANVNYSNLNGGSCGTGVYNANLWDKTATKYGVRGGGFNSADDFLRTSDRTEAMNYFTTITERDSTVGFRGVYSLSGIKIDGGEIQCSPKTICPEDEAKILNIKAASCPDFPDVRFQYTWYVKKPGEAKYELIENAGGESLVYNEFENNTASALTYRFKRTGICAIGVAESNEIEITILVTTRIVTQPASIENAFCNVTLSVSAIGSSLTYQWIKNGANIPGATSAVYTKSPKTIDDTGRYVCQITGSCHSIFSDIVIVTYPIETSTLTDSRDGKIYKIRKMPDGHWWMVEDLKFGTCNASTYKSYYKTSVSGKIASGYYGVCFPNSRGTHLYNWQGAVNHANAKWGGGYPTGNKTSSSPTQWQGICPPGWHLPSGGTNGEYQKLYNSLCNNVTNIYPGIDIFEGILNGYINDSGSNSNNPYVYQENAKGTYNTSSSYSDVYGSHYMSFTAGSVSPQVSSSRRFGYAVRCVKDY
ncbi:MAG: SUMF1/EgtB/PvdO family nonheme iron enzyme, partial [Oscillibacter sp.]|nr:SUMF1/EgtB/PvdO family nonheme iron enzyme [Oscillibacter sp.]